MIKTNEKFIKNTICKCVNGDMTNKKAASILAVSERTIKRYKKQCYNNQNYQHGNKNKIPSNKVDKEKEMLIVSLYNSKYSDFNFAHFNDCLAEYESINISYSLVYRILNRNGISSPKHHKRKTKQNIHPLRERRHHFGELVQIDASEHRWFFKDTCKYTLHGAIDDATGKVLALYFDRQETLSGYYHMLDIILHEYGIPEAFYGDNRTIFEYKRSNLTEEYDTHIQFKRCCQNLGIELITTSISQAKGRIERLWQTLQSRLLNELKLNNINDINSANEFLKEFIIKFNNKFSVNSYDEESYFVERPNDEMINNLLAIYVERMINCGSSFKYKNHYYQLIDGNGELVKLSNKTKIEVIQTYDNNIVANYNNNIYSCIEVEYIKQIKEKKERIIKPVPANHPWKRFKIK